MLTISSSQMRLFSEAAMQRFENKMVEHLGEFLPPLLMMAGEEALRKTVQLGIISANDHGFTHQGPVRLYLELMLLFGSHFNTDPQYPWAIQILTTPTPAPQMQRAELLFEKALEHQARVVGPKGNHTSALHRDIAFLTEKPFPLCMKTGFAHTMLREITQTYPQKAAYVGLAALEALVRRGIDAARAQGLSSAQEIFLVVTLMLFFGHGCIDDPLYPWIAQALENLTTAEPAVLAHRLETKALAWLEQLLTYYSKETHS